MERGQQDPEPFSLVAGHLALLPLLHVARRAERGLPDLQVREESKPGLRGLPAAWGR